MGRTATVWLLDGDTVSDDTIHRLGTWLTPAEADRYQGFVRPQRRRQFLLGRLLLREALGAMLGMPACTISLTAQAGAAPRLDRPGFEEIGISVSHSRTWVACAVSETTAVALDIEVRDPTRDVSALAEQAFDADTNAWLGRQPAACRVSEFYRLWCTHEAKVKLARPVAQYFDLPHAALSIAVSSAHELAECPQLYATSLLSRQGGQQAPFR